MAVCEADARLGEGVYVWGLDEWVAVAAEVSVAEVICLEDDDVW